VGDGRLDDDRRGRAVIETLDLELFQAECVEAFVTSWTARGFAESTIADDVGVLEPMLAALGRRSRPVLRRGAPKSTCYRKSPRGHLQNVDFGVESRSVSETVSTTSA
jgi:hypothetical protein